MALAKTKLRILFWHVNVFTPLVSLRVGGSPANVVNAGTGHIMYGRHISADGRNAMRQTVKGDSQTWALPTQKEGREERGEGPSEHGEGVMERIEFRPPTCCPAPVPQEAVSRRGSTAPASFPLRGGSTQDPARKRIYFTGGHRSYSVQRYSKYGYGSYHVWAPYFRRRS